MVITAQNDPNAARCVFYDGGCPVCRREIRVYRRARGAERIDWIDVADTGAAVDLPPGLTRAALLKRFTVIRRNGRVATGAEAFVALWRGLARWAAAGRLMDNAVALWFGERLYRGFLRLRALWRPGA